MGRAAAKGRRFALVWEQKGCSYCRDMNVDYLTRSDIREFIEPRFALLQLNLHGDRTVTDFDGQRLREDRLAAKYGVRLTPTIQFFPADPGRVLGQPGHRGEMARMPGLLTPADFLSMFRYAADTPDADADFSTWSRARPR
jgi:thioredoxin-related protein